MDELAIKIEHVSKQYRLGAIGGGTLKGDLQSWWARKRGREDPNSKIGSRTDLKTGDKFLALDDVSFEVKKGEAVGIIGHNGAGKSTLLKLLSRVTAPTSGTISYNGRIASMLEVGTGFHQELTGRENVYMNGAILGMTKAEIDRKMDQIIDFAEMRQFIDTPVKRYSSGMYVKLAFSVAAHLDSEIMVMDEVLAVGDMKFQQKCLGRMGDAANTEGRTVLYVSHNMNTIRQLCTRCIVLDHGKVVFDGDTEKAISIYMNRNSLMQLSYDLGDERPYKDLDDWMRISRIGFLELASEPLYRMGDTLKLRIDLNSEKDDPKIALRIMVRTLDGVRVGMTTTAPVLHIRPGPQSMRVELPLTGLAPGSYQLTIVYYSINTYGTDKVHDRIMDICSFVIDQDPAAFNHKEWLHGTWGYLTLPELKVQAVNSVTEE